MVTYKDILHQAMLDLAVSPIVRFIGYNINHGNKMNGTLIGCEHLCIETPVAENLMTGIAIGYALEGFLPILCFERMDFMLAAADALINHLGNLQPYGFKLPVMIRACVGSDRPLDPGTQHTQDLTDFFRKTRLSVVTLDSCEKIKQIFSLRCLTQPTIFVEYRRLYETTTEEL